MTKEEFELGEKDTFSFQCEKELNFKISFCHICGNEILHKSKYKPKKCRYKYGIEQVKK